MEMKTGINHTVWFVSNCNHTNGARARWNYGKSLIDAGLKLNGYGECFGRKLREGRVPWRRGGLISKHKFYLG